MTFDDDKKLLKRIDDYGENLTPWEIEFVESCLERLEGGLLLSQKQREIAERIDCERVA